MEVKAERAQRRVGELSQELDDLKAQAASADADATRLQGLLDAAIKERDTALQATADTTMSTSSHSEGHPEDRHDDATGGGNSSGGAGVDDGTSAGASTGDASASAAASAAAAASVADAGEALRVLTAKNDELARAAEDALGEAQAWQAKHEEAVAEVMDARASSSAAEQGLLDAEAHVVELAEEVESLRAQLAAAQAEAQTQAKAEAEAPAQPETHPEEAEESQGADVSAREKALEQRVAELETHAQEQAEELRATRGQVGTLRAQVDAAKAKEAHTLRQLEALEQQQQSQTTVANMGGAPPREPLPQASPIMQTETPERCDGCTQTLSGAGAAVVEGEEDEDDLGMALDDALEALGVMEFHKQSLVDALLALGGSDQVESAQANADKMIENYCDQGFA